MAQSRPDRWRSHIINRLRRQGGLNLYGFVGNSPIDKWDLLGLSFWNSKTERNEHTYSEKDYAPYVKTTVSYWFEKKKGINFLGDIMKIRWLESTDEKLITSSNTVITPSDKWKCHRIKFKIDSEPVAGLKSKVDKTMAKVPDYAKPVLRGGAYGNPYYHPEFHFSVNNGEMKELAWGTPFWKVHTHKGLPIGGINEHQRRTDVVFHFKYLAQRL